MTASTQLGCSTWPRAGFPPYRPRAKRTHHCTQTIRASLQTAAAVAQTRAKLKRRLPPLGDRETPGSHASTSTNTWWGLESRSKLALTNPSSCGASVRAQFHSLVKPARFCIPIATNQAGDRILTSMRSRVYRTWAPVRTLRTGRESCGYRSGNIHGCETWPAPTNRRWPPSATANTLDRASLVKACTAVPGWNIHDVSVPTRRNIRRGAVASRPGAAIPTWIQDGCVKGPVLCASQ